MPLALYLQAKGEDGEVHSLGGVYIGSSAPSNPLPGRWWFDDANSKLFLYDGSAWQIITGSGGGGSSTTVVGGDGIVVSTSGSTATVAVDLASSANGLLISSGKLQAHIVTASDLGTVKIGDGIDVDAAGEISVDLSGVDVNADLEYVPNGNSNATITNTAGDDATVPIAIQADSDVQLYPNCRCRWSVHWSREREACWHRRWGASQRCSRND